MIEKNADNGPNPYASLYIPRENSRIVNEIEISNKERQKYQNSLLHALPLKFLQFVKTEINDSLIFIIIPILKHCLSLLHRGRVFLTQPIFNIHKLSHKLKCSHELLIWSS